MKHPVTVSEGLHGLNRLITTHIKLLPTITILVVVILIALHHLYPPFVEKLGEFVGLAKPSVASVLTLIVCVTILDRLVTMYAELTTPRISVFEYRELAYRRVEDYIAENGVRKVDLLQFSGYISLPVLRAIAAKSPRAQVRMLLMNEAKTACFDVNTNIDHPERMSTAVGQIAEMERDNPEFKVEIKFYDCPASVSAVMFDDSTCVGWYHAFPEENVVKMRGHRSPAILVLKHKGHCLQEFARKQFDNLWNAKPVSKGANP